MTTFKGRVAIVTGAGAGLGRSHALGLARKGARVVVNYRRNADLADEVVRLAEQAGGDGIAVGADVENTDDIVRLFDTVAVATMVVDDECAIDGREITETFRALSVFTWKDGRWLWAAGQTALPRLP